MNDVLIYTDYVSFSYILCEKESIGTYEICFKEVNKSNLDKFFKECEKKIFKNLLFKGTDSRRVLILSWNKI